MAGVAEGGFSLALLEKSHLQHKSRNKDTRGEPAQ